MTPSTAADAMFARLFAHENQGTGWQKAIKNPNEAEP
jgi:hypothetical protein